MTATHVLLLVYAAVLVGAGLWVSRRVGTSGDFFVAGRALPGAMVFVTLLAANIGAGSTVGATGLGYRHGLSAWWWSGSAAIGCVMHGFFTVGDFLEWRFDRSVRVLIAAILWLGTAALLSGQLIAMAWAFEVIAGLPRLWGALLSGLTGNPSKRRASCPQGSWQFRKAGWPPTDCQRRSAVRRTDQCWS